MPWYNTADISKVMKSSHWGGLGAIYLLPLRNHPLPKKAWSFLSSLHGERN